MSDRAAVLRTGVGALVALGLAGSGTVQSPFSRHELLHGPVIIRGEAAHHPIVVKAARPAAARLEQAEPGKAVRVSLTQYCLRGETRRGRWVRPGIVAADPSIFPLARYVEVFLGKRYLGRYLVDDTGKNVIGLTLDIWTPNCREARRFGRQWGQAVLVPREPVGDGR